MGCSSSKYEISNIHDTCPICFNMIDKRFITPCNHHFCNHCLQKWCNTVQRKRRYNINGNKISITCPMCRKSLEDCYKKKINSKITILKEYRV